METFQWSSVNQAAIEDFHFIQTSSLCHRFTMLVRLGIQGSPPPPHGDLQPSVMKRLVICQRWPYVCFNMENRSRSIKRPVADPRMRKIKEAVLRSRKLQEEQKLPNRVKASPSRRQKTYKKQPRTLGRDSWLS